MQSRLELTSISINNQTIQTIVDQTYCGTRRERDCKQNQFGVQNLWNAVLLERAENIPNLR